MDEKNVEQDQPTAASGSRFARLLRSDKSDKRARGCLWILMFAYLAVGLVLSLALPDSITVNGYYYEILFAAMFVALVGLYLVSLTARAKKLGLGQILAKIVAFVLVFVVAGLVSMFLSGCLASNTPKWPGCKVYSPEEDRYYFLNERFVLAGGGEVQYRLLSAPSVLSPVWDVEQGANLFNYDMYGVKDVGPSELVLSGDGSIIAVKHKDYFTDAFSTRTRQRLLRMGLSELPETAEDAPENDKIIREMMAIRSGTAKPVKELDKMHLLLAFENLGAKLNEVLPESYKEKYPDTRIQIVLEWSSGYIRIVSVRPYDLNITSVPINILGINIDYKDNAGKLELLGFDSSGVRENHAGVREKPDALQQQEVVLETLKKHFPKGTLISPN